MKLISVLFLFICIFAFAKEYQFDENSFVFSGRVSKISLETGLLRIKIDFENMKYLNRKDRVDIWNDSFPSTRCTSIVEARSNEYILVKVLDFSLCRRKVGVTTGSYLHMYSEDLEKSLKTGKELVRILMRKRLALSSKKTRYQKNLNAYMEKINQLNKRYEILRQKMEVEWAKELADIKEDRSKTYVEFKSIESRLNDVDHKLQVYKVENQNLKEDRWSLDPELYFKK